MKITTTGALKSTNQTAGKGTKSGVTPLCFIKIGQIKEYSELVSQMPLFLVQGIRLIHSPSFRKGES